MPVAVSSQPQLSTFKGHQVVTLNPSARFPFSFGVEKAKLIVEHFEAIRQFVESNGASIVPPQIDVEADLRAD